MGKEAVFQAEVLRRWGHSPRIVLWRANSGKAYVPTTDGARPIQINIPGCPDIIGWLEWCSTATCKPGGWDDFAGARLHRMRHHRALFLGIETKSPTGTMRDSQLAFQARLLSNHGIYIKARGMSDVDSVLIPLVGEP